MEIDSKTLAGKIVRDLTNQAKRQPGAILLTGGWGVGKTHLWLHAIATLLNSHSKVYVSLFGIKSSNELKSKLASALMCETESGPPGLIEQILKELPGALMKTLTG
jgi:chromosomal replication initiation ATPase DnaA